MRLEDDSWKSKNNNTEGVQHRIGGVHQDKFEMLSQRRGGNIEKSKTTYVDAYQDTGISEGVLFSDWSALTKE